MTDTERLLQELDRWRDPQYASGGQAHILAAIESPEHQQLGARLRRALKTAPARPPDLPVPAPC